MTDATQASTSDLLSFINGNMVEVYGNAEAARRVMPTLASCMKQAVERVNSLWQKRAPPFDDTMGDDVFGTFLVAAYQEFYVVASHSLKNISATFNTAWYPHYFTWFRENEIGRAHV